MHKPSIAQLVYNATFPRPKTSDPASFSAHITRNLVPEVRIETSTFYGSLDCIEAQYPGLDYSYPPHRMRLSRFPWHRKLFKVFDELGLTEAEISSLCRWEGTKSARERYEKEEGVIVRDTTAENVRAATPPPPPSIECHSDTFAQPYSEQEAEVEGDPLGVPIVPRGTSHQSDSDDEESSDEEMESYGLELNQRLLYATAARERGADIPLDEDWEQWLKEAVERGNYSDMLHAIRTGQPLNLLSSNQSSSHGMVGQLRLPTQSTMAFTYNSTLRNPSNNASGRAR
ncbi:hypothetical protein VTN77DRAFT_4258 [Rasamsonia byssochlamydoides]|uniref:uncharacterized protein n=1 Tax=Rasamsonia byssochlamydoides TaxID=89139 RepID=UPI003741F1A2